MATRCSSFVPWEWSVNKAGPESGADSGGGREDGMASHPPSQVLLCNVVGDVHGIINQPPPLHRYQYGLLWTATPSATFHANFLDQHLGVDLVETINNGARL